MTTWNQHYTADINLRARFAPPSEYAQQLRTHFGRDLTGKLRAPVETPCRALMVVEPRCTAIVVYTPPQPQLQPRPISHRGKSAEETVIPPEVVRPVAQPVLLKSPFPYFGAKSRVAADIWQRFGSPASFIDPFFGSGAVLLARPEVTGLELVNDLDGYITNFWRAIQHDPQATAAYADQAPFECDLHARHSWLIGQRSDLVERLEGDPDFYDAKIAGWWVWGMSMWIGSGFCSGSGSWVSDHGRLVKVDRSPIAGIGRQLPHLTGFQGVQRKMPEAVSNRGVQSERAANGGIYSYFEALRERFRKVRVTCGDWTRVLTPAVLEAKSPCAILLDPPYNHEGREAGVYANDDSAIYAEVRTWAIANGDNPNLRIAYCGYEDGFVWPDGWEKFTWKATGGYSNQGEDRRDNPSKECIYFSPACLKPEAEEVQLSMFA